jgi:mono/diheme cytochrome c family protein
VRGRASFHRVCGNCHPGGDADVGSRLLGAGFTEAHVRQQIRDGGGDMSAVPETCISDSDLDDVLVYLRELEAVR